MLIAETARLRLRQFELADAPQLFQLNSMQEILTYIPGPASQSIADAERIIKAVIWADYQRYGFGRWAVELVETAEVIGFCGPKFLPEFDKVELGYRYLPQYWRLGFGFEAATAALAALPTEVKDIIALIAEGNIGSEKLAQKLQMKHMGMSQLAGRPMQIFHKWL